MAQLHKRYPLKKADFKYFVQECKLCMSLLGMHGAPVTFAFELPPTVDDSHLGGSIQYEDSQKVLIYLSPEWPREVSRNKLKYLAAHEAVELLLIQSFLPLCEDACVTRSVDKDKWENSIHQCLNRLLMLYDADLLTDVAEGQVFE